MKHIILIFAIALMSVVSVNAQTYSGYSSYTGKSKSSSYYSGSTLTLNNKSITAGDDNGLML